MLSFMIKALDFIVGANQLCKAM